jgi:hypothetical protein
MVFFSQILSLALFALSTISIGNVAADDHHSEPVRIHTIHHHHVKKYPVYKKIEVPVIKETKVPFTVHVPIKSPYPVVIKPYIVKVPVHHYPVHTSEHQHHDDHHDSHYDEHQGNFQHTESHVQEKW